MKRTNKKNGNFRPKRKTLGRRRKQPPQSPLPSVRSNSAVFDDDVLLRASENRAKFISLFEPVKEPLGNEEGEFFAVKVIRCPRCDARFCFNCLNK